MLDSFQEMSEAKRVALYFLFGNDPEDDSSHLYIGQTGGCGERLKQNDKGKIFWTKALIVVSLTNSLTQTHALFLEWQAIKQAKDIGRYNVLNGNGGNRPHTPPPLEADCAEIFDTALTLLATLGYPVFEPFLKKAELHNQQELFYCKSRGATVRGMYTDEGFVV